MFRRSSLYFKTDVIHFHQWWIWFGIPVTSKVLTTFSCFPFSIAHPSAHEKYLLTIGYEFFNTFFMSAAVFHTASTGEFGVLDREFVNRHLHAGKRSTGATRLPKISNGTTLPFKSSRAIPFAVGSLPLQTQVLACWSWFSSSAIVRSWAIVSNEGQVFIQNHLSLPFSFYAIFFNSSLITARVPRPSLMAELRQNWVAFADLHFCARYFANVMLTCISHRRFIATRIYNRLFVF